MVSFRGKRLYCHSFSGAYTLYVLSNSLCMLFVHNMALRDPNAETSRQLHVLGLEIIGRWLS